MTTLRRAAATSITLVSLALVGTIGLAPAASATSDSTVTSPVAMRRGDVYCC